MKNKVPITYTGSNTDNLYIIGIRNDHEVKLKVKEIGCHGPIKIDGGLNFGDCFKTFKELYDSHIAGLLEDKKIYTVTDGGVINQYIIKDSEILQIAGEINSITHGNMNNTEEISSTMVDEDGIINYNLVELVNGDYRYKNHKNLAEVYCDMPNLVSGVQMFYGNPLKRFFGNLASLDNATHMFSKDCELDEDSICSILDGIKEHDDIHRIDIGYDSSKVSMDFLRDARNEFASKGWNVTWYKDGLLTQ